MTHLCSALKIISEDSDSSKTNLILIFSVIIVILVLIIIFGFAACVIIVEKKIKRNKQIEQNEKVKNIYEDMDHMDQDNYYQDVNQDKEQDYYYVAEQDTYEMVDHYENLKNPNDQGYLQIEGQQDDNTKNEYLVMTKTK